MTKPIAIGTQVNNSAASRFTLSQTDDNRYVLYIEHWPNVEYPANYTMLQIPLTKVT